MADNEFSIIFTEKSKLVDLLKELKPVLKGISESDEPYRNKIGDTWSGTIKGYCPVQGEGTIDGRPWYFRARHDSWSMSIAENPTSSPVEVRWGSERGWYYEEDYGSVFDASWMPYKEAWEFIEKCFEKYRQNKGYITTN